MIRLCLVDKSMNSFTVSNRIEWNNIVIWFYLGTDALYIELYPYWSFVLVSAFFLLLNVFLNIYLKKKNLRRPCNSMKWLAHLTFFSLAFFFLFFIPFFFLTSSSGLFSYQAIAYLGDDFMFQLFGKYRDMALAVKNPCHLG